MGCCCSCGPEEPYGVLTEENQNSNTGDSTRVLSQERESCTLIIPPRLLNEENSNSILNRKNSPWTATRCLQTNGIKFEFNLNNIEELVKFVKAVINSEHNTKSRKTQTASKEFDQSEFEAFKRLVGDDFSKAFTVINSNSDKVVVTTTQSPDLSDVKEKLNYLRKDEMTLNPEQMTQLMATFNQNLYLPTAFVVLVPNENKVTIYSFDYSALTAAKHHIGVQSGKVKLTARERAAEQERNIRAEDSAKTDHTHLANTQLAREHATSFTTESGILVSVYKADITQLTVDAIVNAANEHLKHGGGVAAAIAKAAGVELEIEGDDHVTTYGPLKVTDVLPTTAGKLPCRIVLHAVGPRWKDYQDKRLCQKHLEQTVFNCLKKGHELQVTSIAVTSISSAIFGVPKELCARMYLAALQRFEQEYGSDSKVRHIHFVDISDEMVSIIQDTFSHHWDCDVTFQKPDKQVMSLRHLLPVDGEVTPAASNSHQPRTHQDLDLVLKFHAYDEKNIPVDLIYYCDEQCASLQSEGDTPEDSICVASKPFSCLDLHKARWNLEGENLETLTTKEGACLVFPATSHCLANKENVYDVTKRVISQIDQEKEQRRALNVIIVPCKAGAAASSTNVDIGANDFAAEMRAAYARYVQQAGSSTIKVSARNKDFTNPKFLTETLNRMTEQDTFTSLKEVLNRMTVQEKSTMMTESLERMSEQDKSSIMTEALSRMTNEDKSTIMTGALSRMTNEDKSTIMTEALNRMTNEDKSTIMTEALNRMTNEDKSTIMTEALSRMTYEDKSTIMTEALNRMTNEDKSTIMTEVLNRLAEQGKSSTIAGMIQNAVPSGDTEDNSVSEQYDTETYLASANRGAKSTQYHGNIQAVVPSDDAGEIQ